jgi:predicted lipoprotein
MKNKLIRYAIIALVGSFILYHSVYFEKLSAVRAAAANEATFDAAAYARTFWNDALPAQLPEAVNLSELMVQLESEPEQAFAAHSHALGIGNIRYFLVQGEGEVSSVSDNHVTIRFDQGSVQLETEFVYGNAVRDAAGTIDISDFSNTMDLNRVSEEVNRIIRTDVIPPFREKVKEGDQIAFAGALELNQKYLQLEELEIIPVSLKIITP